MISDLEKDVESYFKKELNRRGCLVMKFVSPGLAGVPDRIVLFPAGRVEFVELKREGEKPRPLQRGVMRLFAMRDVHVHVVAGKQEVDRFVRMMEESGAFGLYGQ